MKDKNYILIVLGINSIPRILTSFLTLISFPILIRSIGSSAYGTVIYLAAIVSTLEAFVDFGISSAAGKSIADARSFNFLNAELVLLKWAKLQSMVAIIGFLPLLMVTYFLSVNSKTIISIDLLILLVLTSWITICINFVKASLNSLLAFKHSATLDIFESILRSSSWLIVSFFAPSAKGLAIAQIFTACIVSVFALLILKKFINKKRFERLNENMPQETKHNLLNNSPKNMLKESFNFLWLRLITRIFQSVPIFLFGNFFGASLVGIVGAFSKIADILNFPFSIIGNAIAVKAQSIVFSGYASTQKLWEFVVRIIGISIITTFSIYFISDMISDYLLPNNMQAKKIIPILSLLIFSNSLSSIIAPMSDYIGGLKSRNILMTIFTIVQTILLYVVSSIGDMSYTIITYLTILLLMNFGYIRIAIKAFFNEQKFIIRQELKYLILIIFISFLITHFIFLNSFFEKTKVNSIFSICLFLFLILTSLFFIKSTRLYFYTKKLLEFS